jgi:hypothetical protein
MLASHSNLLPKYGNFKGRKLEICPSLPKNLSLQFHKKFLEMWSFLKKILKGSLDHVAWDILF